MKKGCYFFIVVLVFISGSCMAQEIISVAGKTTEGYLGDDSVAINCSLHWPEDIALDASGNIYIADADNNVIRKINGLGIISTVVGDGFEAGTGTGGFGGDGGPASAARLYYPSGIAFDATGNMYICDKKNNRVRMVTPAGIISTFAGTGIQGFSGDGGPATIAQLDSPTRVTVDLSGNIDIADAANNCIRQVNSSGNINTIAGTGATPGFNGDGGLATMALLNDPQDMAIDPAGIMYIADYQNNRIRKVDLSGNISTFAGIGYPGYSGDSSEATVANIYQPSGIATDAAGNVYFSDFANARVRVINAGTGVITTYAGDGVQGYGGDGGPANEAKIYFPQGLAINAMGGVYIADKGNNRIRYASATLAVKDVSSTAPSMTVYPDPCDGNFNVQIFSGVDGQVKITVCNITGQKIAEINTVTNKATMFNVDAPPGIYFLSAHTSSGVLNQKVLIR
jgi:sugar lactone lactonase YvrE